MRCRPSEPERRGRMLGTDGSAEREVGRRLPGFDEKVISLYARGMTTHSGACGGVVWGYGGERRLLVGAVGASTRLGTPTSGRHSGPQGRGRRRPHLVGMARPRGRTVRSWRPVLGGERGRPPTSDESGAAIYTTNGSEQRRGTSGNGDSAETGTIAVFGETRLPPGRLRRAVGPRPEVGARPTLRRSPPLFLRRRWEFRRPSAAMPVLNRLSFSIATDRISDTPAEIDAPATRTGIDACPGHPK